MVSMVEEASIDTWRQLFWKIDIIYLQHHYLCLYANYANIFISQ